MQALRGGDSGIIPEKLRIDLGLEVPEVRIVVEGGSPPVMISQGDFGENVLFVGIAVAVVLCLGVLTLRWRRFSWRR